MQLPISFLGCRVGRLTKVRFWLYVLQVIGHFSPRLVASDEVGVEEDGDNLSFRYESGNDTTANGATVESSYTWSRANLSQSRYHYLPQTMDTLSPPRPDVPTSERRSHASNVAAGRGLIIAIKKRV